MANKSGESRNKKSREGNSSSPSSEKWLWRAVTPKENFRFPTPYDSTIRRDQASWKRNRKRWDGSCSRAHWIKQGIEGDGTPRRYFYVLRANEPHISLNHVQWIFMQVLFTKEWGTKQAFKRRFATTRLDFDWSQEGIRSSDPRKKSCIAILHSYFSLAKLHWNLKLYS